MTGDWPALEGIEWPKNYATTADYPEEFDTDGTPKYVKKVETPAEAQHQRFYSTSDDLVARPIPEVTEDDGARLDSPDAIRRRALDRAIEIAKKVVTDIDRSLDHLNIYDSNAPGGQLDNKVKLAAAEYLSVLEGIAKRVSR